jgi:hypothetical protein
MFRAFAAAAVSTILIMGGAAAAEFPVISIERTCSAAKPLDAQDTSPVETCQRDERAARAQLEAQWDRFAESNRNVCVQQTYVGGYPSYDDVLTCLQMYGPSSAGASTRTKRKFGQ